MEKTIGFFPFGSPVRVVEQIDRGPKRVFVLGVYASAVHARWVDPRGNTVVGALAVASEPYIYWRGDYAAGLVNAIAIPPILGTLCPASKSLNGPSGMSLENDILCPMGVSRSEAWLADLVPHSCMNPRQESAIGRSYEPLREKHELPVPSVPPVPKILANSARQKAILNELVESQAKILILLGDQPIRWFLNRWDSSQERLADFGTDVRSYGRLQPMSIEGRKVSVLPLAHPRQVARLGFHSKKWYDIHQEWKKDVAPGLLI